MPSARLVSLRRAKNRSAPATASEMPTARPPRALQRHFILGTMVSAAAVCTLANTVAGVSVVLATLMVAEGIVPPCASQLVNCGTMAMTRPATTDQQREHLHGVLLGGRSAGHSTVMWPSFTPMLHVNG